MSSQVPGPVPPPSEPTPPGAPAPTPPASSAPAPGFGTPPPQYGAPAPGQGGGYGGPGGYQPPTPSSGGGKGGGGKTGLIIAIVAAVVLLIAGAATALILVLSGGDDDSDKDTDGDDDNDTEQGEEGYLTAVEDYFGAYDDGDCDLILDLYPEQFTDVEACEDDYPYTDPDDVEIEIGSLEATDVDDEADPTEATVSVTFTEVDLEGDTEEEYSVDFTLEKDGDDWIITEYESV